MNVGVIGCGAIAEIAHLPAYQNAPGVKIMGLADPDARRLWILSKKFQVRKTYSDYHELLRDPSIDVVSVCVPTGFHHEVVLEAAVSGKQILCEKPIARTEDEASDMVAAQRKYGVQLYVGFPARFTRVIREVVNLVGTGLLKRPLEVHARSAAPSPPKGSWYLKRKMGGGALFDMGAHGVDLLLHYFGEGRVTAASFECGEEGDADLVANVSIDIDGDISARVEADWTSQNYERSLKVKGVDGSLSADMMKSTVIVNQPRVTLGKRVGQFSLIFDQRMSEYQREVWEFVESVRSEKESSRLATGVDGLRALRLVEDAYRNLPVPKRGEANDVK